MTQLNQPLPAWRMDLDDPRVLRHSHRKSSRIGNLSLLATLATSGGASSSQDGHVGAFDGHIGYASDDFLLASFSANHKRNC